MGGRGGRVIYVTNLNDDGKGSFREALTTPGPRIVFFKVAGTINLLTDIEISEPYLTIAGSDRAWRGRRDQRRHGEHPDA